MMTSSPTTIGISSNTNTTNRRHAKKKKKSSPTLPHSNPNRTETEIKIETHEKWRSEEQQQIYSSKLIQALSNLHLNTSPPSPSTPRRGRAVREAADRALAASAKGRSRWSRAILTSRIKLKFRKQQNRRAKAVGPQRFAAVVGGRGSRKARVSVLRLEGKSIASVQRKVKILARLVPGCRKQPVPVLLEEAADYIAALEMQVRAMTSLTNFLSGSTSDSSAPTN